MKFNKFWKCVWSIGFLGKSLILLFKLNLDMLDFDRSSWTNYGRPEVNHKNNKFICKTVALKNYIRWQPRSIRGYLIRGLAGSGSWGEALGLGNIKGGCENPFLFLWKPFQIFENIKHLQSSGAESPEDWGIFWFSLEIYENFQVLSKIL